MVDLISGLNLESDDNWLTDPGWFQPSFNNLLTKHINKYCRITSMVEVIELLNPAYRTQESNIPADLIHHLRKRQLPGVGPIFDIICKKLALIP